MEMGTGGEPILVLLMREVGRVDNGGYGDSFCGYTRVGCGGYSSVERELYFEQTQYMQMMTHWQEETIQASVMVLVTEGW